MQRAGVVGRFERPAEGSREDGQRPGDRQQQHRARVVRRRPPQIPRAQQRRQPAPGGRQPPQRPHYRREQSQHGQPHHRHQHRRRDHRQPLNPRLAHQRRIDGPAGELQLEDQQRAERHDRHIGQCALPPGIGRASPRAARGHDRLPGRAIGGNCLRQQRQPARAQRDIPGQRRQPRRQQPAAQRLVERRHVAQQRDQPHPDQRPQQHGGQRQHRRLDDVQQRDVAPPRAAAAQPGGVFGALLGQHRRRDHRVDQHRADQLQHDHHQRALREAEALAEAGQQAGQLRALIQPGQLLGEPRLHDFEPLARRLRRRRDQPRDVQPEALQQRQPQRGRLLREPPQQVRLGRPEAQLAVPRGERQEAHIERGPVAQVGGRLEDADHHRAARRGRAKPERLRAEPVAHPQPEGVGLLLFERNLDRPVGAGRLRQAPLAHLRDMLKVALRSERGMQSRVVGLPVGADDVAAAAQRRGLPHNQPARRVDRFAGERAAHIIDGGAIGGQAGLQEAQIQVGRLGVAQNLAQPQVAHGLDEDRRGGGQRDRQQRADQQHRREARRGEHAAHAQPDDLRCQSAAHLSPPTRAASPPRRAPQPSGRQDQRRRARRAPARPRRATRPASQSRPSWAARREPPRR